MKITITMLNLILALIVIACLCALAVVWAYHKGIVDAKDFNCVKVNHNTMCEEVKK